MIEFESVSLRYGNGPLILRDASFHIQPGSFHLVTGVSGAGKSSLLKLIYLVSFATSGKVKLFGRDVLSLSPDELALLRRRIGVVFQDFQLLDHLSVRDNVSLPLRVTGKYGDKERDNVAELLAWVGLGQYVDHFPSQLSGGQQQRVAIARAVIARPAILLADEPTGNVDDHMGIRLVDLFEELNRIGTTVIVATHSTTLVSEYNFPTLRLSKGEVTAISPRKGKIGRRGVKAAAKGKADEGKTNEG